VKQQPEEERGKEEEANILVAPIGFLLVKAQMVLAVIFQNALPFPRPNVLGLFGPARKRETLCVATGQSARCEPWSLTGARGRLGHAKMSEFRHDLEGYIGRSQRIADLLDGSA
jgi:hypothetical protein